MVTPKNYTSQNALRGARRQWLQEANYTPQSASRRRRRAPLRTHNREGWPGPHARPVPEAGQEAAAWAGLGGAEELAESEALAGGAGKGAGPEEGETLKRKQQQAERL